METYSLLRAFADSWFLIAMFAFFLGCGAWAFWPSLRGDRDAASEIPFRNETLDRACDRNCETCDCTNDFLTEPQNG